MSDRRLPDRGSSDRYEVERALGRGGMATVYLARDRSLERPVALKVLAEHLADDPEFRTRFLREARLAGKLVHPNVVQVYDVGEDQRGLFIVMELVTGETLAEELKRRGRLPADEVVEIGVELCSALEAAHAAGLVHRDIKPQNIMRNADGAVKLTDFGIAFSTGATRHTEIGTVLGTAAYLAPEQARGERVTAAADLYSLGIVLYELLVGESPFTATTLPELLVKREQEAILAPRLITRDTPLGLDAVVMACLAASPAARPASAADLAARLAVSIDERPTGRLSQPTVSLAAGIAPEMDETGVLEPPRQAGGRNRGGRGRLIATAAGVTALAAAGVIIASALRHSGADGPTVTSRPVQAALVKTHPSTAARVSAVTVSVSPPGGAPATGAPPHGHGHGRAGGHGHGHAKGHKAKH